MPSVVVMVATVAVLTEFLKTALAKVNVVIKGAAAVVLAILASAGVVAYHWISIGDPFSFAIVTTFVEVAIAATIGYKVLTERVGNGK